MMDAYFIVGPEGSGTNMLEEAFAYVGCYRDPRWASADDRLDLSEAQSPIVVRRSLPHAGIWPNLGWIATQIERAGFHVHPVIILREWDATWRSVLRRDSARDKAEVLANMARAVRVIGHAFPVSRWITYEAFCLHALARRNLFASLGLPPPVGFEIKYANPKTLGEPKCA